MFAMILARFDRGIARIGTTLTLFASPAIGAPPDLRPIDPASIPDFGWSQQAFRIPSTELGSEVELYVATPPSYPATTRGYPVLVVFDGEYDHPALLAGASALAADGHIPESIVVSVRNVTREADFTPNAMDVAGVGSTARGDSYVRFLADELFPALSTSFRIRRPWVLIGHSHGGLLVSHACCVRRAEFDWIAALDAPVHLDSAWIAQRLIERASDPDAPPLRFVAIDVRFGFTDERWEVFRDSMPEGAVAERTRLRDERHETLVFPGILRALRTLFSDYSIAGVTPETTTHEFIAKYRNLESAYGGTIAPPLASLRRALEIAIAEVDGESASLLLGWLVDGYGRPADLADWNQRVDAALARAGESRETVASMLAAPKATEQEMSGLVGRWEGEIRSLETGSDPIWVEFEVVDGHGAGRMKLGPESEAPVMELRYLVRRSDGGVDFGFQNGMHPRGMLIFEAKVENGRLAGVQRLRGIEFRRPDGRPRPRWEFELALRAP